MSVRAPFDYHPAKTVDEAISLLQQYGDEAKILAGGHSLIPAMKLRLSQPEHLIDIGRIPGLSYIREENGAIAIGALTTYTQIETSDVLRRHFALLPECASVIADQQVRNRGTLVGSIAHSDPASDMPGVVLALKGEIVAQGPNGRRTINADDFFVGTFTTALEPNEVVIEVRLPIPPARTGSAYEKLANKASHYAVAGSAAITGAAMQTMRAKGVEAALTGKKLDAATIAEAASHAPEGLELVSDIHGSKEYRSRMTVVMAPRAITRAVERV